jgi:hypothetical protein
VTTRQEGQHPEGGQDWLDDLFGSVRAFSDAVANARTWAGRAEKAKATAWAATFLASAARSHDEARARLADIERRVAALGAPESLTAPLDRLASNLPGMRAELESGSETIARVEVVLATSGVRGLA